MTEDIKIRVNGGEWKDSMANIDTLPSVSGSFNFDLLFMHSTDSYNPKVYISSKDDWASIISLGGTDISETERIESYRFEYDENTTFNTRTLRIIYGMILEDGSELSKSTMVDQLTTVHNQPIWKDIYYETTVDFGSSFDYYIEDDNGDTIYNGRAYAMPNHNSIRVNISKIVQDYLSNEIDGNALLEDNFSFGNFSAVQNFYLYNDSDELLEVFKYRYDWSYSNLNYSDKLLTEPINGHRDPRMLAMSTSMVDNEYYLTNANKDIYTTGYCGDYALYYLQRNGGYAAFLIEGTSKKTDNYDKYSYNRAFDNTRAEFEQKTYHNQVSTTWEMNTGWLTDKQAENLSFNLIPSNTVYMHNLVSGEIVPVVLTNKSIEYKTFKNNGKKLVSYTINLRESQNKQML